MRTPLTEEQKLLAITLYLSGTKSYVQIAHKLKVKYGSINSFMTRWKRNCGILKERGPRRVDIDDAELLGPSEKLPSKKELKLLRNFYRKYMEDAS